MTTLNVISSKMLYEECDKLKNRFPEEHGTIKHFLDNIFGIENGRGQDE